MEARRNALCQKGGDRSLVSKAKIPDHLGALTSTFPIGLNTEFEVPTGSTGLVIQAMPLLSGTASTTYMVDAIKYGGCIAVPLATSSTYANTNFSVAQWDNAAEYITATSYTRAGVSTRVPYRIIGLTVNVLPMDSSDTVSGIFFGGQLDVAIPTCSATSGGFATQNAYGQSTLTAAEVADCLLGFADEGIPATKGITVRTLFSHDKLREFHAPASVPNITGAAGIIHDGAAMGVDSALTANLWTGRNVFPTVMLRGAKAGSKWALRASLIIETDGSERDVSFMPRTFSEYSPRWGELWALCNDVRRFPQVTEGYSFWPTVRRASGRAWKLMLPVLKKAAVDAAIGALA